VAGYDRGYMAAESVLGWFLDHPATGCNRCREHVLLATRDPFQDGQAVPPYLGADERWLVLQHYQQVEHVMHEIPKAIEAALTTPPCRVHLHVGLNRCEQQP